MIDVIPAEFANRDLSFVIEKATTIVLRSPIETPVQTSFGIMTDRPAVYLLLQDTQGHIGVGEIWCNFPSCGAEHRARLLETAILPSLICKEFSDPAQCFHTLQTQFKRLAIQTGEYGPIAQSIAGIDGALWDLVAKRLELPLHKLLGANQSTIGVYASGINPRGAAETVSRCRDAGYTAFKLKIGFGDDIDYPNIESICAQLDATEQLMVDANQAWTLDEANVQVVKLSDYPIQWLEEPITADSPYEHWTTLAEASAIALAAGENIADTQSFSDANSSSWLSVMQPDLCKWGGFSGVVPVARDALEQGKRLCPHFLGGGVGLAASAHLLSAVGGPGLLEIDSNPNPLRERLYAPRVENGQIVISDEPGLGINLQALSNMQMDY
ncbi:MAG: L-alanine-DL-glutamate epimerase-like enolase superfamily enzyme [Halioglobus sp.]|jgi:L-alanine-DL-glutamate epimerase-like enolase superfamily enzyme